MPRRKHQMRANVTLMALRRPPLRRSALVVLGLVAPIAVVSPAVSDFGQPDAVTPADVGLVPELSTETTRTVRESDGTLTLQSFSQPVNFEQGGNWYPIDNTLVDDPSDAYIAANAENSFDLRLPDDMTTTPVRMQQGSRWVTMRMHDVGPSSPDVSGDSAVYGDVNRAASVSYTAVPDGVKEVIHLAGPSTTSPTFQYTIDASAGLTPSLDDDQILFRDANDRIRFVIPRGLMQDANGASSMAVQYDLQAGPDTWLLTVIPNNDWLQDPSRAYPVDIDPTLSNQPDLVDCYFTSGGPDSHHCGSSTVYVKAGLAGSSTWRGALNFDVSAIPATATVNTSSVNLYLDSSQTGAPSISTNYALYSPGKAFDANATWNSSGANGAWSGGSPGSTAYATMSMNGANSGYKTFGIASLVRGWVDGTIPNTGVLLKQVAENASTNISFYSASTDPGNDNKRPYLNVNYTAPPTAIAVTPCVGSCNPAWQFTSSLTPTLSAIANNGGTGTVNYSWELRRYDDGVVISTGTSSAPVGQASAWTIPPNTMTDTHGYEFRVGYVGSSTTWSPWQFLGVDVDDVPQPASDPSLSPCSANCTTLVSSSVTPVLTAQLNDSDSSFLSGSFEVRQVGTQNVLASSTATLVPEGDRAEFFVPSGKLVDGGSYEFRVGTADDTSTTWGAWTGFSVSVPTGGPVEPRDVALSTCVGDCSIWNTDTTTPTFTASRSDMSPVATAMLFEVKSGAFTASGSVPNVAPMGTATWTVPSGTVSAGSYLMRGGTQTSSGTTWSAWHAFEIIPSSTTNAVSFPASQRGGDMVAGSDPNWSPPSDIAEDGPSGSYTNADVTALELQVSQDEASYKSAGYSPNQEGTTLQRNVSIPKKYAPMMYIHPDETDTPISGATFVKNSVLKWAHDAGCRDHVWNVPLTPSAVAGHAGYTHQSASNILCSHGGVQYATTDEVAPHNNEGGPDGIEGFYMDLADKWRDGGSDTSGGEPVYYRYVPKDYIAYWFAWGESDVRYGPLRLSVGYHEGEWEHIAIKLDSNNNPLYVKYFYHKSSCTRSWKVSGDVPRFYSHPQLAVARDSHGNYPLGSDPERIKSHKDEISSAGRIWYGTKNLQDVTNLSTDSDWYGYGGGWGVNRDYAFHSGPEGPSAYRSGVASLSKRCE